MFHLNRLNRTGLQESYSDFEVNAKPLTQRENQILDLWDDIEMIRRSRIRIDETLTHTQEFYPLLEKHLCVSLA